MAAWLDRAGPFKTVIQPDSALSPKYRVEATVTELYGYFRLGRPAAAVMAVQFALVDVDAIGWGLLFDQTITRRVPLQEASPSALVRGYNRAVSEILSELAARRLR